MKKSNIILTGLLVALWLTPIIVWGYFKSGIAGEYYTGFGDNITTISISNPNLKAEDIKINLDPASRFPSQMDMANKASYLYYKGKRKYLPTVNVQSDMLLVGEAIKASSSETLTLHIRINGLQDIVLNGVTIWQK